VLFAERTSKNSAMFRGSYLFNFGGGGKRGSEGSIRKKRKKIASALAISRSREVSGEAGDIRRKGGLQYNY